MKFVVCRVQYYQREALVHNNLFCTEEVFILHLIKYCDYGEACQKYCDKLLLLEVGASMKLYSLLLWCPEQQH